VVQRLIDKYENISQPQTKYGRSLAKGSECYDT